MRKLALACLVLVAMPLAAIAAPKEDAFQIIEQFKKAFDASDVQGVVKLFAPDAIFLGTVSPKLSTTTEEIGQYFQALRQFMPRSISIEAHSAMPTKATMNMRLREFIGVIEHPLVNRLKLP